MQISRRDTLLAGAAAAVAGVPIGAAASDPVIDLVERLKAARSARNVADDAYEEAALEKGFNRIADHPVAHVKTADGGEYLWSPDEIRRAATDGRRYGALTQKEAERYVAEAEAHQQRADHLRRELGLDPFKDNAESREERYWQLEAEVLATPAVTVAGVLAKLRGWYGDDEIEAMREDRTAFDNLDSEWAASVYRDIERLAGGAS